jgi:hypothetical protein
MADNKPMWLRSAEALEKAFPDSRTNFRVALQEYRPLWDDPKKQEQAMKLNLLLKKKLWDSVNRKAQAAINLERLLKKAAQNHPAKSVVWNIHANCYMVTLVNPIPSTNSGKRSIRTMVADWLTILTNAVRR